MSRSGYIDDGDSEWPAICYRGAVVSALRGKRGQVFLRDLVSALDAMPEKRLIADALEEGGQFCAIGAVGAARGVNMAPLDPDDPRSVGAAFDIAEAMAREIVWLNDEAGFHSETPEARWARMRTWAERSLIEWESDETAALAAAGLSQGGSA